jgi:hypothetical protein
MKIVSNWIKITNTLMFVVEYKEHNVKAMVWTSFKYAKENPLFTVFLLALRKELKREIPRTYLISFHKEENMMSQ